MFCSGCKLCPTILQSQSIAASGIKKSPASVMSEWGGWRLAKQGGGGMGQKLTYGAKVAKKGAELVVVTFLASIHLFESF